jgi:CO/xanthine dehydrogenase Mo-binding subunit
MTFMESPNVMSRRSFLARTGLTFVLLAGGGISVSRSIAAAQSGDPRVVNAWVSIAADDTVIIQLPATETGQGVMTALPLILAEELDADWSKVRVETVTHDAKTFGNPKIFGMLYTAGSHSVEGYFDSLRRAGALARRVLIYTAARHWAVPTSQLRSEPGVILNHASGGRLRFGEIAMLPNMVIDVPAITDADLKQRSAYRLIGQDVDRLEVPAKTRGAVVYSIDVRVPGMVYAAVLRAPVEGEAPATIDDASATALNGVVAVVALPGVALGTVWLLGEWQHRREPRRSRLLESVRRQFPVALRDQIAMHIRGTMFEGRAVITVDMGHHGPEAWWSIVAGLSRHLSPDVRPCPITLASGLGDGAGSREATSCGPCSTR